MEAYFKLLSIKYDKIYILNQFVKDNLINKQFIKIIKIWLRNVNLLSYDLVFLPVFDLDSEHFALMVFLGLKVIKSNNYIYFLR
jgi:Ulp1 family protease